METKPSNPNELQKLIDEYFDENTANLAKHWFYQALRSALYVFASF